MDIPIRFAYLPSVLSLIIPWLAIFLSRSDLRRKMIHFTILGSIAGPVSQIWYLRDYWHPAYTLGSKYGFIEDTIFAGLFVGITIVLYNFIFRVKSIPIKKEKEIRKAVRAIILVSILIEFDCVYKYSSYKFDLFQWNRIFYCSYLDLEK